jgi:sulfur carrier protein
VHRNIARIGAKFSFGKDLMSERTPVRVSINGETRELAGNMTVAMLAETLGFAGRRIAVEINQAIVPRSLYAQRRLAEGDVIEIVQAIGGG